MIDRVGNGDFWKILEQFKDPLMSGGICQNHTLIYRSWCSFLVLGELPSVVDTAFQPSLVFGQPFCS